MRDLIACGGRLRGTELIGNPLLEIATQRPVEFPCARPPGHNGPHFAWVKGKRQWFE